jgi:hypothetical protein
MAKPHHKLVVWKRSLLFLTQIYRMTAQFPAEERFGLVSQMRRASDALLSELDEISKMIIGLQKSLNSAS